jgi:hypothetical protein
MPTVFVESATTLMGDEVALLNPFRATSNDLCAAAHDEPYPV